MLTIERIDQLPQLLHSGPQTRFHLALADRSPFENRDLERDLKNALHDCGAIEVWFALAIGLPLSMLLWVVLSGSWVWALFVPFVLMGLAKWIGHARGRRRLRQLISALESGSATLH